MTWQRDLGVRKLAALRRELQATADADAIHRRPKPIFVRHAEAWFPDEYTLTWRAYIGWIMEQAAITNETRDIVRRAA